LLLRIGTEVQQVRRHDVGVDGHARGQPDRDLGQLLCEHRIEAEVVGVVPAVLLRHIESEEPLPTSLEPDAAVDRTPSHHLVVVGEDRPGHERLDGLAELVVILFEQRPVQFVPSVSAPPCA
jgi:hypothetical protein